MKKILFALVFFYSLIAHACPTCVGKTSSTTVPFFDQDFYQPNKSSNTQVTAQEYGKREFKKLLDSYKGKK